MEKMATHALLGNGTEGTADHEARFVEEGISEITAHRLRDP
jgi:hypothetical protein